MNEMNQKFCQSCGMPMGDTDEQEDARKGMLEWFPTLKRWKK